MTQRRDGMTYAPEAANKPEPVVAPGEFAIAATHLDHGHIFGQCNGLTEAGATLKWVYDPEPERVQMMLDRFPGAQKANSFEQVLDDAEVKLVASAAIPSERCEVGLAVMGAGKDYFTDKSPFTTLEHLDSARAAVQDTGRKYMVYFSERLHVESAMHATTLLREGAIGDIIQIILLAPHRLNKDNRPAWFFDKSKYGGILTDIGSHQFEQFLAFTGATDGTVEYARVANHANQDKPGLEDFGETVLTMNNGTACYCRLDWFTPDGLPTWGDGRVFVVGTRGTLEIRKYLDLGGPADASDVIYLADEHGMQRIECAGQIGYPFFGHLIRDCLDRTEHAMTQHHAFKAAELSMRAQEMADAARPVHAGA
ncbi:MAG: Gfo/Idh/MocA family oxidoreductase [Planctomycetota bacterium]